MKKGIISALSMLTGVVAGAGTVGKIQGDKLAKSRSMSAKHMALFLMMNQCSYISSACRDGAVG